MQLWISGSEVTGEFRGQIYTPDYFYSGKPRPVITTAPSTVDYGENFTFGYSGVQSLDRVVFQRLTGKQAAVQMGPSCADAKAAVLSCAHLMPA